MVLPCWHALAGSFQCTEKGRETSLFGRNIMDHEHPKSSRHGTGVLTWEVLMPPNCEKFTQTEPACFLR